MHGGRTTRSTVATTRRSSHTPLVDVTLVPSPRPRTTPWGRAPGSARTARSRPGARPATGPASARAPARPLTGASGPRPPREVSPSTRPGTGATQYSLPRPLMQPLAPAAAGLGFRHLRKMWTMGVAAAPCPDLSYASSKQAVDHKFKFNVGYCPNLHPMFEVTPSGRECEKCGYVTLARRGTAFQCTPCGFQLCGPCRHRQVRKYELSETYYRVTEGLHDLHAGGL
mmetsp:Transcript_85359/g.194645  ORF Transcript_85359/g.194645 Transcript_85359/m.194645 type:complete len:227 (-) Transcript_85359:36-716(-)